MSINTIVDRINCVDELVADFNDFGIIRIAYLGHCGSTLVADKVSALIPVSLEFISSDESSNISFWRVAS